jgi:membrane protease YdiL (CAAX protease family)
MEAPQPVPWHRADLAIFAAFFLAVIFIFPVGVVLLLKVLRPSFEIEKASGVVLILLNALMDGLIVGFIVFLVRLHGKPLLETLRWVRQEGLHVGWLISAGVFLALTVLIASSLFPAPNDSVFDQFLKTPAAIAAFAFFGIAVAPLLEEIIFRGFLYRLLADLYTPRLAVPVTAVAFAGLHFLQLWGNWAAMFLILIVGYVLTRVRRQTDSLIPSVIMHTSYNAFIFGLSAIGSLLEQGK